MKLNVPSPPESPTTKTPQSLPSRNLPVREDCWSENATATLVDAWGRRYVELKRGNLRQKDWKDVADAVNALHGRTKKTYRTDIQCKNRIDTIKKKYKLERARVDSFGGATLSSSWPFYDQMDSLIGTSVTLKKPSPSPQPPAASRRFSPPLAVPLALPFKKTLTRTPMALPQKRSAAPDDGFFRRNYSAVAAAAAAAAAEDVYEDEGEDDDGDGDEEEGEDIGIKRLARAIDTFGEIYQRMEAKKLRQMVELEKKRMHFAMELEEQRMRTFMEAQVQLERIKRNKRSSSKEETYR